MTEFHGYKILRKLGEGSFGRTYLAEHMQLQFRACLKQLIVENPTSIHLFHEEARLLAKVRHPFLPSLLGYWDEPRGHFIALSYLAGESLEDIVAKGGPVDDEHICWILDRVLTALSYLHYRSADPEYDRGIIHCDIKPANILLRPSEHEAYLVDFGMAYEGPDAASKARGGTLSYMPPEFMGGLPPLPPSDLYSLGKTAIFLAGGHVERGECPPDMARPLAAWVSKMIRHDLLKRFQTADEARVALHEVRLEAFGRTECPEEFKRR